MEGREFEAGPVQGDQRFLYLAVADCGTIEGLWFKPPGTPTDCKYVIGAGAALNCAVIGRTARDAGRRALACVDAAGIVDVF